MSIEFIEFKKILNENNILLFDSEYRIAHYRFNNMILKQSGGNDHENIINNDRIKLLDMLSKYYPSTLNFLVNSLIKKDTISLKYIVDKYSKY